MQTLRICRLGTIFGLHQGTPSAGRDAGPLSSALTQTLDTTAAANKPRSHPAICLLWPLPPIWHAAPQPQRPILPELFPRFSTNNREISATAASSSSSALAARRFKKTSSCRREEAASSRLQALAYPCAKSRRREPSPARTRAGSGSANSSNRHICANHAGRPAFFSLITAISKSCKSRRMLLRQLFPRNMLHLCC